MDIMAKRIFLIILVILNILLCVSCDTGKNKITENTPFEENKFLMGTIITQKVYGEKGQEAISKVFKEIERIENNLTVNKPGGEINLLNETAGKTKVKLSDEAISIIEESLEVSKLSGGAFDISIGPLVKAWGINTDTPTVPSDEKIKSLLKLVNYEDILVDTDSKTVELKKEGMAVDLGGIAKGYAGDRAVEIYKSLGVKSAYINLGGNLLAYGTKPDGSLWKIGIQDPRGITGEYVCIIEVADKSIVTSGDYERYFVKDGKKYHHIIDPHTGYPSNSGLISTTIVADSSMIADALSTATFVLGLDKGLELINSLEEIEAVFITEDKKIYVTDGLKDSFKFTAEDKGYIYVKER